MACYGLTHFVHSHPFHLGPVCMSLYNGWFDWYGILLSLSGPALNTLVLSQEPISSKRVGVSSHLNHLDRLFVWLIFHCHCFTLLSRFPHVTQVRPTSAADTSHWLSSQHHFHNLNKVLLEDFHQSYIYLNLIYSKSIFISFNFWIQYWINNIGNTDFAYWWPPI